MKHKTEKRPAQLKEPLQSLGQSNPLMRMSEFLMKLIVPGKSVLHILPSPQRPAMGTHRENPFTTHNRLQNWVTVILWYHSMSGGLMG